LVGNLGVSSKLSINLSYISAMKKSLLKVICALLLLTFVIALTQNSIDKYPVANSDSTLSWEVKNLENIKNEKEVSLNSWLSLYNSGMYQRVEIENGTDMKW